MREAIPEFEEKGELFKYLKENRDKLIAEKKSMLKHTTPVIYTSDAPAPAVAKAEGDEETETEVISVKVVANAANVLDSDMDVIVPGAYDNTIKERKHITPHLHDHIHKIEAKVGEVTDIYTEQIKIGNLGLKGSGSTECLVFETDVMKSYNEQVFNQYKAGKINQHSIGLSYVKIDLAINDEDSEKEKEFFDSYIGQVINPEKAEERGYFWVVKEITLLENSAVLFGSNPATPTLSTADKEVDLRTWASSTTTSTSTTVEFEEETKQETTETRLYNKRDVEKLRLKQRQLKIEGEIR